jgi:tRNA pseudouridine38-40 synthase
MARYKVILVYDGTHFFGFQRQAEELKTITVQAEVEKALRKLGWQDHSILAAGRTDTGVHASGQVIAFDLEWKHATEKLLAALNANLPPEVAAKAVSKTGPDFHPRFDAISRRYQYHIFCHPVRNPLRERYAWRIWPDVETSNLQKEANQVIGGHDFRAFGSPSKPGGTTIRNVINSCWRAEHEDLVYTIEADAFLYHMVRRLVYIQVTIGQKLVDAETFEEAIRGSKQTEVLGLAPPQGLFLVEVVYPEQQKKIL